jgi:cytochrome P450
LHIRDAHFLETVYSHARRDKKLEHVNFLDAPLSMVATVEHSLHRLRRAALNTYFTKPQVGAYTPRIQEKVNNLIARLDGDYKGTNKVLNLSDAFKCFAGDVVGDFCFASDHDFISAPDFKVPFLEAFDQLLLFMQYSKYFPFLLKIFHSLPDIFIPSTVMTVLQFQREITNRIQDITNGTPQDRPEEYIPVFRGLSSSNLPPEEKTLQRLAQEGITLAGAGQTTVPGVLKTAMFHLFQETSKMERLSKEIMTVFPDPAHPPSLSQLEQLPYLTGVIMEGKLECSHIA